MSRALQLTRNYLIVIAAFVVLRFLAELASAPSALASEISVTRLLFVIPFFLGLRLAREGLEGFGELVLANALYVGWAIGLVMIVTAADTVLGHHTHFAHGALGPHLLGHVVQFALVTPVVTLLCWITYRINR